MRLIDQLQSFSQRVRSRIDRTLTGPQSKSGDNTELVEGGTALDREQQEKAVLVMEIRDERAEELTIPGTSETVASYNPEYPADDLVIKVRFVETLDAYLSEWTATDVLDASTDGTLDAGNPYFYPESRLEPQSERTETTLVE